MCHSFCIHWPTEGHLGCFHSVATVNNAAMNTGLPMFFQTSVLVSSRIFAEAESLGYKAVLFFIFLRERHTDSHSVCTSVRSHQGTRGFPFLHVFSGTCSLIYRWQPLGRGWGASFSVSSGWRSRWRPVGVSLGAEAMGRVRENRGLEAGLCHENIPWIFKTLSLQYFHSLTCHVSFWIHS